MSGFLLHTQQLISCPHSGMIQTSSTTKRVLISGVPVATLSDLSKVLTCPFAVPPGNPQPCITVKWEPVVAKSVYVNGESVLLSGSTPNCRNIKQHPQGQAIQLSPQPRVKAR